MKSLVYRALRKALRIAVNFNARLDRRELTIRKKREADAYQQANRRPWAKGYYQFRNDYFQSAFDNPDFLTVLREGKPLPANYGFRLDARIVEIPWVLSRVTGKPITMLDAGSSLNSAAALESTAMKDKNLTILTLAPEGAAFWEKGISYVFGDLRDLVFRDNHFDVIACISTIEHVGMDNTMYAQDKASAQQTSSEDFVKAIHEFRRVLKPDGVLYITFPFGRYEDHGWFQQFDAALADKLIASFGPRSYKEFIYQYLPDGWILSDRARAATCEFFDVRSSKYFDPTSAIEYPDDFPAGERAVACLELYR